MGGSSKKDKAVVAKAVAALPAVSQPQAPQIANYPAFEPGQQGLLSQQMAQGYGGYPSAYSGFLSQGFSPGSVPNITRPDQIAAHLRMLGLTPITSNAAPNAATGNPVSAGNLPPKERRFSLSNLRQREPIDLYHHSIATFARENP